MMQTISTIMFIAGVLMAGIGMIISTIVPWKYHGPAIGGIVTAGGATISAIFLILMVM